MAPPLRGGGVNGLPFRKNKICTYMTDNVIKNISYFGGDRLS